MLIPFSTLGVQPRGVLHVGAHLGEEAPDYQAAGVQRVLWIEAQPSLIPALTKNVQPLGHRVVQALVSDADSDAPLPFYVTNNGQSSSMLEFGTHAVHHPHVVVTAQVQLPTRTLASILAQDPDAEAYDFLNMDIQGAELLALKGLGDAGLQRMRWVYTEVNDAEVYKKCALLSELDEYLGARGFKRARTQMCENFGWGDAFYTR
jgi:FkbM family methyltransferase